MSFLNGSRYFSWIWVWDAKPDKFVPVVIPNSSQLLQPAGRRVAREMNELLMADFTQEDIKGGA